MAWIYKRGSKWWIGWRSNDGKLVQKSLKTKLKETAQAELDKLQLIEHAHAAKAVTADFIAAITGKASERKKTVAVYFDAWLDNAKVHLASTTVSKYEQLAREFKTHVKADAAPITMEDITADDVRGYLTEKRKATTHETTKGFRRILSSIFLQAQNEGQTTRNPVALAKLPKTLAKETGKRAFTLAEVKQLHDKASPFWQWMIRASFFTGFSLGDLVTLRRLNVDLKQGTVSIKRRKTGKPVTVPLNAGLMQLLKETWPAKAEDYFWPAEANRYLTTGASSFSQEFFDIMAGCGLVTARVGAKIGKGKGRDTKRSATGIGFHCMRHTFVTNLKVAGAVDILSGHRRYYACVAIGMAEIPCRLLEFKRSDLKEKDIHRLLAEFNPQRVKSVASIIAENFLLGEKPQGQSQSWGEYQEKLTSKEIAAVGVDGSKSAGTIGERQQEFLAAAVKVIDGLKEFWPLTVRQIHYGLLNAPPLTQTTQVPAICEIYARCLAACNKVAAEVETKEKELVANFGLRSEPSPFLIAVEQTFAESNALYGRAERKGRRKSRPSGK